MLLVIVIVIIILIMITEIYYDRNKYIIDKFKNDPPYHENIHIFMSCNREYYSKYGKTTFVLNENYCSKWGFQFHKWVFDGSTVKYTDKLGKVYESVPHYARYIYLLKMLDVYPDDHYFIYIDTDAAIINDKLDIRKWIPYDDNVSLMFANEGNMYYNNKLESVYRNIKDGMSFNSGVFICRNCEKSRENIGKIIYDGVCNRVVRKKRFYDQSCIVDLNLQNIGILKDKYRIQSFKLDKNVPIYHDAGYKTGFYQKDYHEILEKISSLN